MFGHCNLKPNGPVGDDEVDFLESAMVEALTCDESGSPTQAATQRASCTWPRVTIMKITTTKMASEAVTTTAWRLRNVVVTIAQRVIV
jgi:hypothetical protein